MFDFLIASAHAQTPAAAAPGMGLMQFVPLILIFVVFYFLIIRPQKKRVQEEQKFINALEKGQEVYTKSGMIGTIVGLTDRIVTLEVSDGVKVKYVRSQIAGVSTQVYGAGTDEKK